MKKKEKETETVNPERPLYRKGETAMRAMYDIPLPNKLQPFDVSKIVLTPNSDDGFEPDKLMVFLGKRRTGKTFSIDSMLGSYCGAIGYDLYEIFPAAIVITGTKLNSFWNKRFPDKYIHTSLDVIDVMFAEQAKFIEKWWKHPEWQDPSLPTYVNPYRLLVIDDMVGEEGFKDNNSVVKIAIKGRHYKICVMLTTQYIKLINTTMRENLDLLFVMFQSTLLSKETIAETFMGGVDKRAAIQFIDEHTQVKGQQRNVLVWDNSRLVRDLNEKMFELVPEEPEDYLVGDEYYWQTEIDRYREFEKKREGRRARSRAKWEKLHIKVKEQKINEDGLANPGRL